MRLEAILVDGVNRDALVPLDWVIKPDTTYYKVDRGIGPRQLRNRMPYAGNPT